METLSPPEPKLDDFPLRTEGLSRITRYSLYETMYYRGTILHHTKRVSALVKELNPYMEATFGDLFDPIRARLLAEVHDDPEIFIGDIQAGNKEKMSVDQTNQVEAMELQAIEQLSRSLPVEIEGFNYRQLLEEAHAIQSVESQFVKYLDKYDAFGEALNEVYAGNTCFVTNVVNEYGTIKTPTEYYIDWFARLDRDFPELAKLFENDFPISLIPQNLNFPQIAKVSQPHTPESFSKQTGNPHYDFWKSVMIKNQDSVSIPTLITQTEFPKRYH